MMNFYFFVLKSDKFWSLHAFSKKQKLKGKFSGNVRQNICRLIHVLAQFFLTKSEVELDHYHQEVNMCSASRAAEEFGT